MKLWDKGYQLDALTETFMTGDDPLLDQSLVIYDCLGSMAHARMLEKIGILTKKESHELVRALNKIIELSEKDEFIIKFEHEDVHTAVECTLTEWLGDLGKKLHTARSRNDQILLDIRLYSKDRILNLLDALTQTSQILCLFAEKHHAVPMPGRTHFQRAMPSSAGLWAGAFAESLLDDLELIKSAYRLVNQCPLGSAASYGVSLPIDRQYCSDLLGFRKVQNNVLYANNSRGKFEAVLLNGLAHVMGDLSKISTDLIIFSTPEFGYFDLPEKFCPGSSLMPQKRNPCPLELIRAKSALVQGNLIQLLEIIRALPSGYNRDFQETKRPFMEGIKTTLMSLQVFSQVFNGLKVNAEKCEKAFSSEIFATDQVLSLVSEGMPFRDAYRKVSREPQHVELLDPVENILSKTHLGATGNLGLGTVFQQIKTEQAWIEQERSQWKKKIEELRTHLTQNLIGAILIYPKHL